MSPGGVMAGRLGGAGLRNGLSGVVVGVVGALRGPGRRGTPLSPGLQRKRGVEGFEIDFT